MDPGACYLDLELHLIWESARLVFVGSQACLPVPKSHFNISFDGGVAEAAILEVFLYCCMAGSMPGPLVDHWVFILSGIRLHLVMGEGIITPENA